MRTRSEVPQVKRIGIDLAKNSFHVYGVGADGQKAVRKQLSRQKLKEYLINLAPCAVAMEACGQGDQVLFELLAAELLTYHISSVGIHTVYLEAVLAQVDPHYLHFPILAMPSHHSSR